MPPDEITTNQPEDVPEKPSVEKLDITGISFQATYIGPLPHPALLQQYEQILPGISERILKMTEEQGNHRREMEKALLNGQIEDTKTKRKEILRGQIFGLVIGLTGLSISAYVTLKGYPSYGIAVGGTTLVAIVSVFVLGRTLRGKESPEK